jgi:tetrahydromethanopterin S-methyltransferase subunit G
MAFANANNIEALEKRVEELELRVNELETQVLYLVGKAERKLCDEE